MPTVELKRVSGLSTEQFSQAFLVGEGLPTIVTDAASHWGALEKWSFGYLRERFGDDFVGTSLGLLGTHGKVCRLSSYIDYLEDPAVGLPGFWVETRGWKPIRSTPENTEVPHYLLDWNAFERHPELLDDIRGPLQSIPDLVPALGSLKSVFESAIERHYDSVYIGPGGTYSPLHQDFADTHTALTQVRGSKEICLLSPSEGRSADPQSIATGDDARFTCHRGTLHPGETVFIPANWWHAVRALSPSITLSHSFFNEANLEAHILSVLGRPTRLADALALVQSGATTQ